MNHKDKSRSEYIKRINVVLDYLNEHYTEELSLEALAKIANFSEFHFHRIFTTFVGESLYKYIQRIRIEKAANRLRYSHEKSVTEIALDSGFSNSASFARTFKEFFGMSATHWRRGGYKEYSKNCKEESKDCTNLSKNWKEYSLSNFYINPTTNNLTWRIDMVKRSDVTIEVYEREEITIAYLRHIGPFKGKVEVWKKLFNKVTTWAGARGLMSCPETQYFTVFRDNLMITEFDKFKADACISVPVGTKAEGEIGVTTIPAGKYAVAQFDIAGDEYEQAWKLMFGEWLPQSGFQPDDRPCFERYMNDPQSHPQKRHYVEISIPVTPILS